MQVRSRHGVLLVASLAVLTFNLALPTGWTESSPLPWDEAAHFKGALDAHDGIVRQDDRAMRRAVLEVDQYPPGHSLILGAWMSVFGTHVASWLSFGLLLYVLTAILLARLHVAAGLFFVGFGMFGGLAPSLMVESLAVLWVVLALSLLPSRLESRVDWTRLACAWTLALFTLLTKYSFGLPLVAALFIAGGLRMEKRTWIASVVGAATALAGWAWFLSVQDQGWEMFRTFAQNRSNSAGMSPVERFAWYSTAFRAQWIGSTWVGTGVLLSFGIAVWYGIRPPRESRSIAAAILLVGTVVSFAMHPYLLGRNLVVVVAALLVIIGCGLGAMPWDRRRMPVHIGLILLAFLSIPSASAQRTRFVQAYYPDSSLPLDAVSRVVVEALHEADFVRVVGSFNEFSAGWVRLLQVRNAPETTLTVDAPYPLERGREGLDARWDPVYEEITSQWAGDGTDLVVGIEVVPGSPFFTEDYRRWGRWKTQLTRALERSGAFTTVRVDSLEVGVRVVVFERKSGGG